MPQGGVRLDCEKPKCTNCQTLKKCRICVFGRKCDSCKETRPYSEKCAKQRIYDEFNLWKERWKWITKTYCIRCKEISLQKSCLDCEKNLPKCSSENKLLWNNMLYYTNLIIDCCVQRILSIQLDLFTQKSVIEEGIIGIKNALTGHKVMYYLKFHCKLNQIENFWYNRKSWTRRHCKYTLDELRKDEPKALKHIKSFTILRYYKSCLKKMDLYREKVQYRLDEWKKLTSHKKTWGVNNDRYSHQVCHSIIYF